MSYTLFDEVHDILTERPRTTVGLMNAVRLGEWSDVASVMITSLDDGIIEYYRGAKGGCWCITGDPRARRLMGAGITEVDD